MNNVTLGFLDAHGFSKVEFADDFYYIRYYTKWYSLECNLESNSYMEYSDGFKEKLTEEEFIDTIFQHEQAINQYK
jgi:hypothetical protein